MYAVIGETDNYREFTTAAVQFVVEKATPTYKKPTGVTAKYGQTLGDIALANPEGTREDCRNAIGCSKATVDKYWNYGAQKAAETQPKAVED